MKTVESYGQVYDRMKAQFNAIAQKDEKARLYAVFLAGWRAHEHSNLPAPYDGDTVIPAAFEKWLQEGTGSDA